MKLAPGRPAAARIGRGRSSAWRRRGAGLAAALAAVLALQGCDGDTAASRVEAAKAHIARNDDRSAIIELKSALQKSGDDAEARYLLGDALLRTGDSAGALVELQRARDLGHGDDLVVPKLARALLAAGQARKLTDEYARVELKTPAATAELKGVVAAAFVTQGQPDRGQAAINAALRLDPRNPEVRLLATRILAGTNALDPALAMVDSVIADGARLDEAWHLKGDLLRVQRRPVDEAVAAYRKALEVNPAFVAGHQALLNLALARGDSKAFKAQLADLRKAVPTLLELQLYDAQDAFLDGDMARTRTRVEQLLRIAPDDAVVLHLAGALEARAGSLVVAMKHLSKSLQINPSNDSVRLLLAQSYMRAGQPARALTTLGPALDGDQASPALLSLAGQAALMEGDGARAETFFTRAARANPDDVRAQTAVAISRIVKGEVQAGTVQLERLSDTDAANPADFALVNALMQRNDTAGALRVVRRLQAKLPEAPFPQLLEGQIHLARKDARQARAAFDKALALDPAYYEAAAALAGLDMAERQPDAAQQRFEQLLAKDPKSIRAALALAELRETVGADPAEVRKRLTDTVNAHPEELAPRLMLIRHLLARRDHPAARTAAHDALNRLPESAPLLDSAGRAYLAAGDSQQAINAFNRLLNFNASAPQPYLLLAEAHIGLREYSNARQNLEKALATTPDLLVAQRRLVEVHLMESQPQAALQVTRTVQQQRPKAIIGYLMEAELMIAQRRWEDAIGPMKAALQRDPSGQLATQLHGLYLKAGQRNEAVRLADTWLKDRPRDARFRFYLGTEALAREDYAAAEMHYRRVLELQPQDAWVQNNIAWVLLKQGKPGALAYAERAIALAPELPEVMDTLAQALAADKQLPKAIEWQRKAVETAPEALRYQLALARLQAQAGDRAGARVTLDRLAQQGDKFADQAEVKKLLATL